MKTPINIHNIDKQLNFKVPNNYFDELERNILAKTTEVEASLKTTLKTPEFAVPENYFDNLSAKILNRIQEKSNARISLENLEKVNVFKVPTGYFDELETAITAKTFKPTKVIKVNWWNSTQAKFGAIAASVLLIVGLVWNLAINPFTNSTDSALSQVSETEINAYLENQDLSTLEYEAIETASISDLNVELINDIEISEQDLNSLDIQEDI